MNEPIRIFSADGGGVRGIIPTIWCDYLEKLSDRQMWTMFDYFAGTSAGALLVIALSLGYKAADLVEMVDALALRTFPSRSRFGKAGHHALRMIRHGSLSVPLYDIEDLVVGLKDILGEQTRFGECQKPTIVPAYDVLARRPTIFDSTLPTHASYKAWEVAAASAAAPVYFGSMQVNGETKRYVDGGLVRTNPAELALVRALADHGYENVRDRVVLFSFGTGGNTRRLEGTERWGVLAWMKKGALIGAFMDAQSDATDHVVRQLLPEGHFIRLDTPLQGVSDDMDDTSEKNRLGLKKLAMDYLVDYGGEAALRMGYRKLELP